MMPPVKDDQNMEQNQQQSQSQQHQQQQSSQMQHLSDQQQQQPIQAQPPGLTKAELRKVNIYAKYIRFLSSLMNSNETKKKKKISSFKLNWICFCLSDGME